MAETKKIDRGGMKSGKISASAGALFMWSITWISCARLAPEPGIDAHSR
ncbi:MAG TPA: hypothetical protein VFB17_03275 [Gaiellaceae bacterium]|nr:hypothetical protein [Gaiellaceae bacterium]